MDSKVRSLLTAVQKYGPSEPSMGLLQQAFDLLRNVAETQTGAVDSPDTLAQDLYVICAESAFQHGLQDIAKECLKMYFMKQPPANQFLCRAYLCQAQLLAPNTADSPDLLEKAVVYLIKAISMAKENTRYNFLVYNASVLYWQFCRPFLKPNFRQYLARSLHQIVKALDDIDDKDYEWRAQLMLALIECHMDAGRKQDATHIAQAAASFIKQHVPSLYKTVFGLMIRHQLVDTQSQKMQKDIRTSADLNIFYRICRLKLAIEEKDAEKDVSEEMKKILQLLQGLEETKPDGAKSGKGGRRSATPDEKKSTSRSNTSLNLSGRFSPVPAPTRKLAANSNERPHLLLELARLASDQHFIDVAQSCLDMLKDSAHLIQDPSFLVEVEFLQCELMVKGLGNKQESYQKAVLDIRQQAIKRCDEAILSAIRSGSPGVIQAGCVTQWNLCLPLLQPNLRKYVRRPLTQVADALEEIQSLLIQLRCQVHMEVAKCEEDQEQIEVAIKHLHKAQVLDDGSVYKDRLDVALHRLELRVTLYSLPERPEDQAAMIIEQARKANSGTMRMKRSLLVQAGEALAPDAFLLVLESESDTKEVSSGKGVSNTLAKLAGKAQRFNRSVKKAAGHLKRLGDENDKERSQLWGDLAKTARKQEVWDVCRVAARFCLLYDDGRWKNEPPKPIVPSRQDRGKDVNASHVTIDSRAETIKEKSAGDQGSRPATPEPTVPLHEKDLIRILADVNFINGEALIHLLRSEGVELGDEPIPPMDKSKRPKGYVAKKPEEDEDWIEYREWIHVMTKDAESSFLRGAALGIELEEPWIVCSAAAYTWNYYNHVLQQNRHKEIIEPLQVLLDAFKKVGHAGETVLLLNICNALSIGLIQPWIPETPKDALVPSPPPGANKSPRGSPSRRAQMTSKPSKTVIPVTVSGDATPDLKKGLEVCEFVMKVTNGENDTDLVPIASRMKVLQTWVRIKQMLQAQINKNFGVDDENNTEGQNPMTRAIVVVEMLSLNYNGIMEFKESPTLNNAANMIETCKWPDKLVELKLWTRLAYQSYELKQHDVVARCAKMALEIGEKGTQIKGRKMDGHNYIVEQEMLSYASVLYGQSLMENAQGSNSVRRQAIEQFLNSARFGCEAQNAEMVITAGRHYWNAIIPLISQPIERELLREPITILLDCINETTDKKLYDRKHEESDDEEEVLEGMKPIEGAASGNKVEESQGSTPAMGAIGGPDDDLTLRASLYGVLFQSYADKGQWEEGLMAMDQAVKDMPRTNHRLLIFKHMVMTKAKLGQNVQMSIQKFKDGSEDYVAHMWRKVALCSTEQLEQLQGYQNAIETLVSEETQWQKFEYLLEFAQWLYCNEFPIQDALDQVQWAVDILLNMQKPEEAQPKEQTASTTKKKSKQKEKRGKSPPASAKAKGAKPQKISKTASKASKEDKNKSTKAKQQRESSPDKEHKKSTDGTKESGDISAVEYVPVHKEIIIGLVPGNPDLKMQDLIDVRQLEGLFRAHVMMAQLAGQGAVEFSHYCLMAYRFIMAMWQVSLSQSGPVAKEIAKQPPPEPNKGSAKGKPKKEKEVVKEKPKRKHPIDQLPGSTEEWSVYDAPDEALEAFRHSSMKTCGINSGNISKPMLTIILMEKLVTYLRQMGYSQMALPVLALADVISKDILKNEPLTTLIHLRAVEVCVELNLTDGIAFHEKLAIFRINEDQQARSREEMTAWAEKQLQVAQEERRLRETMSKFSLSGKTASRYKLTPKQKPRQEEGQSDEANLPVVEHLGRIVGSVNLRDVWTDAAQLLMKQGLYQPAREMLREALFASESFNDPALTARVLYILGNLSYLEAQYKQAINFCAEAQRTFNGDEMFWYETTMLMIDATLKDYTLKESFRQARGMLVQAINVFSDIAERRPNKASITGFILAVFEAKLGAVQILITKQEHDDLTKPKVINGFLSALKKIRNGYHKLVRLEYNREALPLYKEHADMLSSMARTALTPAEKHEFYIQALEVYTEACNLSDLINQDVSTSTTLQDIRNVSLPCQRECAEIHMLSCDLQLEIFELHMKEERNIQLQNMRKSSVVRALEEMTCATPVYTDTEQRWVDTVKIVAENALVDTAAVHNLTGAVPSLKSKALYLNGRCLRLLSQHKNPDQPMQWQLHDMAILHHMNDPNEVTEDSQQSEVKAEEEEEQKSRPASSKYAQLIQKVKGQVNVSHSYLVEATECLQQALNLALSNGNKEVAGLASLELAECVGQFDPGLTSQYLALHQSCTASKYLEELMFKALVDPTTSQQAALFHQQRVLLADDVTSNASRGPTVKSIHDTLNEHSVAWQRLAISASHMDLLKDLPPNFNIVILQHSQDRSCLYGAILDKPKNLQGGKPAKGAVQQAISKAKVVRTEKDPKELDALLSRYKWWKQDVMQMLLKQEYQRSQQAQREKMLANLEDTSKPEDDVQNEADSEAAEDEKLEAEFKSLLEAMELYLQPITAQLDHLLRPSSASTTAGNTKKGAAAAEKENEYMVLLADPHLMRLPLEALHVLQTENLSSITRDVSLQMLYHKVHQQVLDEAAEKAKKEKEKAKPPSRIPGLRDASKKMSKIIPLDRPVPQGCLPLDTHTFRFVVDPNLDCSETETKVPIECFNKMLEEHEQQFTPRWLGVAGNDHLPSIGEYETYINESSGFIFYGMERFLSNLPPFKVAALNLVDTCQLMMLFDLAQTNNSFLRQSKVDVFKTADALSLEKPVDTALLLSLTGVRSVCLNQWHCTLAENADRLDATMKDLLARGQTIGQTVRLLYAPYLRPKPEVEGEDAQQEGVDESKQATESDGQTEEQDDKISATRSWYNMVCYGAPNLIVTQMSKP